MNHSWKGLSFKISFKSWFTNQQKFVLICMTQKYATSYYYVKVDWKHFPWKCHFQIISDVFEIVENIGYNVLNLFMGTPYLLYSFQKFPNVLITN